MADSAVSDFDSIVACFNDIDKLTKLLETGIDINSQNNRDIWDSSVLHYAVCKNNLAVIEILLKYGADIDLQDREGYTVLIHAAAATHYDLVKLLLEHNASINLQNIQGLTALHWASVNKRGLNIIRLLLEHNASINIKCMSGRTALHNAADQWNIEVIEILLRYGADPYMEDIYGKTSITTLGRMDRRKVMLFLIKKIKREKKRMLYILLCYIYNRHSANKLFDTNTLRCIALYI